MVSIKFENCNTTNFTQKEYDEKINVLNLAEIYCPCCYRKNYLKPFPSPYKRKHNDGLDKTSLIIQRVICTKCGHTHALLPHFIIPYMQLAFSVVISFIFSFEGFIDLDNLKGKFPTVDDSHIHQLKILYQLHWKKYFTIILMFKNSLTIVDDIFDCFASLSPAKMFFLHRKNAVFGFT